MRKRSNGRLRERISSMGRINLLVKHRTQTGIYNLAVKFT